jgi:hypothetical protein
VQVFRIASGFPPTSAFSNRKKSFFPWRWSYKSFVHLSFLNVTNMERVRKLETILFIPSWSQEIWPTFFSIRKITYLPLTPHALFIGMLCLILKLPVPGSNLGTDFPEMKWFYLKFILFFFSSSQKFNFPGQIRQPYAQHPTWRTRVSPLVWSLN